MSLQPNAGSQGEFAGLLAISAYHRANGDTGRDVCLIPSSAHGTNAASAVMAGMRVVVVACDDEGNVDVDDLRAKIEAHAGRLAALMVTYPSTHGVFETAIGDICAMVHEAGGQVYVDGANLNALVGLAKPGRFGADVSHLNLHKTFCIPHGGGGPGVGPVAVREHLAPYLPSHPLRPEAGPVGRGHADGGVGPVSGAPWGSAGILPIPWAYIRMMGPDGLLRATQTAILNANYVAARLRDHYPVLYSGANGLVAHECILDVRSITAQTGVTVDDIAKRLIDYGFHAPTMSFPVAGTLMVEPTESENLFELDRFCDAMIAIKSEIDAVADGTWPLEDSPLRNAPHTADSVIGPWEHAYPGSAGGVPGREPPAGQVLAPRAAHRRRVRGPQPGLRVPAAGGAGGTVIAVFDIDGVLADPEHRQHHVASRPKDWDAFFAAVGGDDVIVAGRDRLRELAADHEVVLLSGRPESTRADTEAWLARHGIDVSRLVLRRDSDHRPAAQVKAELIVGIGSPADVAVVIDDDESVTTRLAASGYTTELVR